MPAVYLPFAQEPAASAWVFTRARNETGMAAIYRAEVERLDARLEVTDFSTLDSSLGIQFMQADFRMKELAKSALVAPLFAGIALFLAAIGLYAVVARSARQRTREIGIRLALGSTAQRIRRAMLWEAMMPVASGLVIGLAMSVGVNRILQAQLVGVTPNDALTLVLAPSILILVALVGSTLPVRRASKVDPAVTLRHE